MADVKTWSDVSLDEINMESNKTRQSTQSIYPQAQIRKGFWMRRTGMERALMGILGVCGVVMVAGGLVFAVNSNPTENSSGTRMAEEPKQGGICVTQGCVHAADSLKSNMHPNSVMPDNSPNYDMACDDFYEFACRGYVDSHILTDSKSKVGVFYDVRDNVDMLVYEILNLPTNPGVEAQSVTDMKTLYAACHDTVQIDAVGYQSTFVPLVYDTNGYGGWPMIQNNWDESKFVWEAVTGQNLRYQVTDSLFVTYPYLDSFNTAQNILYIDQPGFGMPRDFYLDEDTYGVYIDAYKKYIVDVARVMTRETGQNVDDAVLTSAANDIFQYEQRLASVSVASEDRRNTTEMYNPMTVAQLKAEYNWDWDVYFTTLFAGTGITIADTETVILVEPEYFFWLEPLYVATPKNVIADYLYWRRIMSMTSEGPTELTNIRFAYTSVLSGQTEQSPRSDVCVGKASSETRGYGYAVGAEYVNAHFPEDTKDKANDLVNDLRVAFKELVDESVWMDSDTQVVAKEKADMIVQLVGYPDWVKDPVQLDAYYAETRTPQLSTHYENVQGVMDSAVVRAFKSLRIAPNRNDWITPPAVVNAFYSPQHNSISFPAGILQEPFFRGDYPSYMNYGAIGVVMGHEITHGFDDQGRQYDGTGNAFPWWSDETIAAFETQAQCYIDQYSNYTIHVFDQDVPLNGVNTQGENIADNGGVHEAFRAYRNFVTANGPEDPLILFEQFTADQLFFVSYAQVWCEKATEEAQLNQILTDPHSPGKYRVWGPLSNSPDFVSAFNCPAGSNMNRNDKCVLW